MQSTAKPPVWLLIGVTYGVCAALTIAVAVVYFRWETKGTEPVAGEVDMPGPIAVGSLWLPRYPGAMMVNHTASRHDHLLESTLTLKSPDSSGKMVIFYESKLKSGRFKLNSFTNASSGGSIDARLRNGRAQVKVDVRSVPDGAEATITAIEKQP